MKKSRTTKAWEVQLVKRQPVIQATYQCLAFKRLLQNPLQRGRLQREVQHPQDHREGLLPMRPSLQRPSLQHFRLTLNLKGRFALLVA